MNAIQLLRKELESAHGALEGTMADVTNDIANVQPAGKANSIAATYAHLVNGEDMFIQILIQGKPSLADTVWKGKTGMSEPQPTKDWATTYPAWTKAVRIDVPVIREYAKAVYAASDAYLGTLTDGDLDKEIDMSGMGMGKASLATILGEYVVGHANSITGEISALKGTQGLKGYPY